MTTEIFEGKNRNVSVTRFSLGKNGLGVQITARKIPGQTHNPDSFFDWVQMTDSEFEEMIRAFVEFKKVKNF